MEFLSATALGDAYRRGELKPSEVAATLIDRIEKTDGELNAFVAVDPDQVLAQARAADRLFEQSEAEISPLAGVPVAVKDLVETAGLPTAYGSAIFREHQPSADARIIGDLTAQGGIVLGKTNTHEFAWGVTTRNPHFGATRNPHDPSLVPGGSSGGSAVAVATGMAPVALGTDTGGSVRIPAAYCGIFGFKPSHGLIDAAGVIPLAPSLDHLGFFARDLADIELLAASLAAIDPVEDLTGFRVARVDPPAGLDPVGATAALDRAGQLFEQAGGETETIGIDGLEDMTETFRVSQMVEAVRVHRELGTYPDRAAEYGADVRARLEIAAAIGETEAAAARAARDGIRGFFADLFSGVDLMLSPVTLTDPVAIDNSDEELEAAYRTRSMLFTIPQNLAGLPAIAVPFGKTGSGLPLSLQITGPVGADSRVLAAARILARNAV